MGSGSMRAGLVATLTACVASSSFAGFIVTRTYNSVDATLDRIDIYARNTGGDTGTGLIAAEIFAENVVGQSFWRSAANGNWSPTNANETEYRSFVRIDALDPSSSSLVAKQPAANQPLSGTNTVALGNFGVTIASLTGPVPAETGQGALFASFFVTKGYQAAFNGNVGGSAGSKVPFSFSGTCRCSPTEPVIVNDGASALVVFDQTVTDGAPFSVIINGTDSNVGALLSLSVGALPAGISNVAVSPATSGSPASFTVSGLVDYSLNGTTVVVPITLTNDAGRSDTGYFSIVVTPEPASLSLIAIGGLFIVRCRKDFDRNGYFRYQGLHERRGR